MIVASNKSILLVALGLFGFATLLARLPVATSAQEIKKSWQAVAPGRVEPWSGEIRIGSPVVGRIGEVLVKVNDRVFAGEALIRIDDEEVRTRHAKLEAQLKLRKRARPASPPTKDAARRKVEDATADAEQAVVEGRSGVDRAAAARRAGSGSEDAVTAALAALSSGQEQLKQRQAELASFEASAPATQPTELEEQFAMARIDLRGAEAALDNLIIRAPIAGTILQLNVRVGELASPSAPQPLVMLGDISALRVRVELDERDFGAIRIGRPVVVRSPAFPGRNIAGTVSMIAQIIQPGRIGARGPRNLTDIDVAEVMVDLAEPGPLAVGMKVSVYFGDYPGRDGIPQTWQYPFVQGEP